ncbi:MAG: glycine--tRNA ligase subunit beta [bacterium]
MSELFVEIGVEEIPVKESQVATAYLSDNIKQLIESERIYFEGIETFSTPRRLALHIKNVADKGEPGKIVYVGPKKAAAFDSNGNPTQALIGFARSKGVDIKDIKVVKLEKGEFVQAEVKKPGTLTKALIKDRIKDLILKIPFSKTMRWDNTGIRFIRPIRWLIVLYNNRVIPVSIGNIKAQAYTYGLRIGNKNKKRITGFDTWLKVLKEQGITPDVNNRKRMIMEQSQNLAEKLNGQPLYDVGLLDTITNLVESPVPIVGSFDRRFMNLPQEVIMSVMKTHQKYIPVLDKTLALLPYFIGISNNPYADNDVIEKGYERVLHARLEDAEFYYHQDIKQPLDAYVELLKGMIFYPALGTLYDKTHRIIQIASFLCNEIGLNETQRNITLRAANLCKADLSTRLVSEFPELQGIVGKHYVMLKDPSSKPVADAIFEHNNKETPQTLPGAIVSIADRIDTLVGFFSIGEVPTGTQDPYGLRRAAIGIINAIIEKSIELDIKRLIKAGMDQYQNIKDKDNLSRQILDYLYTRFEVILRERYAGETSESVLTKEPSPVNKLISAVLATNPANLLDAIARIDALKDIVFKPDFEPVLLAFKRVLNISKNHFNKDVDMDLLVETPEKDLYNRYLEIGPQVLTLLAKRDYKGYIDAIRVLVEPINTFFDKVLVMAEDEKVRNNRLNLLANIKNLVMEILDINKIL